MDKDLRNTLYKYYVEFEKYQPKMFVFENVPAFCQQKWKHLENIFKTVREIGYEVSLPTNKFWFLNAKDFGVLQDRKRVIIIG